MRDVTVRNSKSAHSAETRQKLSEHRKERRPVSEKTHRKFTEFRKHRNMSITVIVASDDD